MKPLQHTSHNLSNAWLRPITSLFLALSAAATSGCEPPIPPKVMAISAALVPEWEIPLTPEVDPSPGNTEPAAPSVHGSDWWSECLKSAAPREGSQAQEDNLRQGHQGPSLVGRSPAFSLIGMVTSKNTPVQNVRIERGALSGEMKSIRGAKVALKGSAWEGVRLHGSFGCPSGKELKVEARITGASPAPDDRDTWRYAVEVQGPPPSGKTERGWVSLCATKGAQAIPMAGVWDEATGDHHSKPGRFTFACPETAVAKCYRQWGYRPWDIALHPKIAELHAACTRMARADYDGNGKSSTVEGINVGVWDSMSLIPEGTLNNPFEAAWTSEGAVCKHHFRCSNLQGLSKEIPLCSSAEEAQGLAGPARVLVFNTSPVGQDCSSSLQ